MNKEEILAKSVKENAIMDERDKHIRTHRDAFSLWGVIILGIIFMVIKLCNGKSPTDMISLFSILVAIGSLYEAVKTKKRIHIAVTIIFFAATIYFFYKFCTGVI